MLRKAILSAIVLCAGAVMASAASICPSTPNTSTDCDYVITVGTTGAITVTSVPGSTPFNSKMILVDGTVEPGGDASLVGVVNDYSRSLTGLTLHGSGANAGLFDFSFNGICLYTSASYCGAAATGYEGPTTTFSNLMTGSNFQTDSGTVLFKPGLAMGQTTYFALEDSAADINAHGGLTVTGETFAGATATPEPADFVLVGIGGLALLLCRWRLAAEKRAA